jgi:hypothetical protein
VRVGRRVGLEDGVDPAGAQPRQQASQELLVEAADQLGHAEPAAGRGNCAAEQQELERRVRTYRDRRPPPELTGKVVIVVEDGLARPDVLLDADLGPPAGSNRG